jgi:hypothetical protein
MSPPTRLTSLKIKGEWAHFCDDLYQRKTGLFDAKVRSAHLP